MKKKLMINTAVSLALAVFAAWLSWPGEEDTTNISDVLHFAIYDFLLLQIFLWVVELFSNISSRLKKFEEDPRIRYIFGCLEEYDRKKNADPVISFILDQSLKETEQYLSMTEVECSISRSTAAALIKEMNRTSREQALLCQVHDFKKSYVNEYSDIIIVYEEQSELYSNPELSVADCRGKIRFFRNSAHRSMHTYRIYDSEYVIVDEDDLNCRVISKKKWNSFEFYVNEYSSLAKEATSYGMTQGQDSLFNHESIIDYYGAGNVPDIHVEKLEGEGKRRVLDIGTGAGRLLTYFTDEKYEVVAMDKDKVALTKCRQAYSKYKNISFLHEEFNAGSFDPDSFDIVIAYNSIYHTDRKGLRESIERISTILRSGGYLLLTIKTLEGNEKVYKDARELYQRPEHTYLDTAYPDGDLPHHFCDEQEVRRYKNLFAEVVHCEEVPYEECEGDIVQGRGYFMILKKA